jgi:RNA polymerase-binding transcription factor DksA
MRNDIDTNYFKQKLETELAQVEQELSRFGRRNPDNEEDWEGKPADFDTDTADESEAADKIEEYEENTAVVKELEIRYNDIKSALDKIAGGNYGMCEVCGAPIEADRLEANQAARTCKQHMEQ